jgi:hypothetical protein
LTTSRDTTKLAFLTLAVLNVGIMIFGCFETGYFGFGCAGAGQIGFLDFITCGFDTGRFGGLPGSARKEPKSKHNIIKNQISWIV